MLTALTVAARPLALARILLGLGALLTSLEGTIQLADLRDGSILTPVADALPSAESVRPEIWLVVMVAAALMLIVGALSSVSAATLAAGNALLLITDQQLYSNHRVLVVLLCLWMAFAASDRALSIRARTGSERDRADTVPWWPALLMIATVSSCYLFAGLSKVNPEFLSGRVIEASGPGWLPATLVAWATVPAEITIGLGLWWRPVRRLAMALGVALHTSIVVLLDSPLPFTAFALLCLSVYPLVAAWPTRSVSVAPERSASG